MSSMKIKITTEHDHAGYPEPTFTIEVPLAPIAAICNAILAAGCRGQKALYTGEDIASECPDHLAGRPRRV